MIASYTDWGFTFQGTPREAAFFANATMEALGELHPECEMVYYDLGAKESYGELTRRNIRVNSLTGYIGYFFATHQMLPEPMHCGSLSCPLGGDYEIALGTETEYIGPLQDRIIAIWRS